MPSTQKVDIPNCPIVPRSSATSVLSELQLKTLEKFSELRGALYEAASSRDFDGARNAANEFERLFDAHICELIAQTKAGTLSADLAEKELQNARSIFALYLNTSSNSGDVQGDPRQLLGEIAENTRQTAADTRALSGWQALRILSNGLASLSNTDAVPQSQKGMLRDLPEFLARARVANSAADVGALVQDFLSRHPISTADIKLPQASTDGPSKLQIFDFSDCKPGEGLIPCNARHQKERSENSSGKIPENK